MVIRIGSLGSHVSRDREGPPAHLLLSVGWRPRETSGVTQSETDGLRTRGADAVRLEFKGHSSTRSSEV